MSKPKPLQIGWKYYANFVSYPQDKYTSFSCGVKQDDGKYDNYRLFSFEKHDWLENGTQFKLVEIVSAIQEDYTNPKTQKVTRNFNLTVVIEPVDEVERVLPSNLEQEYAVDTSEQTITIDETDLPF